MEVTNESIEFFKNLTNRHPFKIPKGSLFYTLPELKYNNDFIRDGGYKKTQNPSKADYIVYNDFSLDSFNNRRAGGTKNKELTDGEYYHFKYNYIENHITALIQHIDVPIQNFISISDINNSINTDIFNNIEDTEVLTDALENNNDFVYKTIIQSLDLSNPKNLFYLSYIHLEHNLYTKLSDWYENYYTQIFQKVLERGDILCLYGDTIDGLDKLTKHYKIIDKPLITGLIGDLFKKHINNFSLRNMLKLKIEYKLDYSKYNNIFASEMEADSNSGLNTN